MDILSEVILRKIETLADEGDLTRTANELPQDMDGEVYDLDENIFVEFVDHDISADHFINVSLEHTSASVPTKLFIICLDIDDVWRIQNKADKLSSTSMIVAPDVTVSVVSWEDISALISGRKKYLSIYPSRKPPSLASPGYSQQNPFPIIYKNSGFKIIPTEKSTLKKIYPDNLKLKFIEGIELAWEQVLLTDSAGVGRVEPPVVLMEKVSTGTGLEIGGSGTDTVIPLTKYLRESLFLLWSWIREGSEYYFNEDEMPDDWNDQSLFSGSLSSSMDSKDTLVSEMSEAFHFMSPHIKEFDILQILGKPFDSLLQNPKLYNVKPWVYAPSIENYSSSPPNIANYSSSEQTCFNNGMSRYNPLKLLLSGAGHQK
ncbi:MAG: hypothetical protein ACKVI6_06780, partial [Candidatus Poseidoniales archaeon]